MTSRTLQNRRRYDRMARLHARLVRSGSFDPFYRAVADALEPAPGALLLDLGCGSGGLTPFVLPKLGASGSVVGVDVSDAMIERARSLCEQHGWPRVRFERGDLRDPTPHLPDLTRGRSAGIVVFCLSLTAMPEPGACFSRALSWLEPGGQMIVLDSFLQPEYPLAALVIRMKAPLVGADPRAVSLVDLASQLDGVRPRQLRGGVYTLLSGRKPGAPAA